MNNNLDNLFKLLVPAIFLILWALNQLFNKENAPPAGRPGGSLGPRPGSQPGSPASRPSPSATRPEGLGPRPSFPTSRPTPAPAGDDEIVILRSETVRPSIDPRTSPAGNRRNRDRPGRSGRPARAPSPSSPRPRTVDMPATTAQAAPPPPGSPLLIGVTPLLTARQVQQSLNHPARVREAVLLSELLRPPLSLRGRPGVRAR